MTILTRKKKAKILKLLGAILAIQNDYILAEDEEEVVSLYRDLAMEIDKTNGLDILMDDATESFSKRHPEYETTIAKTSSTKVEVNDYE